MIDLNGYNEVQPVLPGEFLKLPPNGYVCQIVNVELGISKAGNPMIILYLDIAEGGFTGFFKDATDRVKNFRSDTKWDSSAIYRQLIFNNDGKVSRFFKGLLTCFEKSNQITFNTHPFDEQKLRGCLIGFIFAEEEYQKRDGTISARVFPKFPKVVADIRQGNFSIPETKKFSPPVATPNTELQGTPIDESDIPF